MGLSIKYRLEIILIVLSLFIVNTKSISQVTDKDGNIYQTVTIGTQEWMSENLNVEHYKNGDYIPQVKDADEWSKLETGAWCYYENDSENGKTYGKLYNWYAINDRRGLAPNGWHIPSDNEWKTLIDYLGDDGGKLKATILWESPNWKATNESGFTGLPGGIRLYNGKFGLIGISGEFWSSYLTSYGRYGDYNATALELGSDNSYINKDPYGRVILIGMSCRCIRDNTNTQKQTNDYYKKKEDIKTMDKKK